MLPNSCGLIPPPRNWYSSFLALPLWCIKLRRQMSGVSPLLITREAEFSFSTTSLRIALTRISLCGTTPPAGFRLRRVWTTPPFFCQLTHRSIEIQHHQPLPLGLARSNTAIPHFQRDLFALMFWITLQRIILPPCRFCIAGRDKQARDRVLLKWIPFITRAESLSLGRSASLHAST